MSNKQHMNLSKTIKSELVLKVVKLLLDDGWEIKSRNRHLKLVNVAANKTVTVPLTPSDNRSAQNWVCQIKRAGVVIPC
jgi:predicted RNA binding protein YcfA (HicA-like mRNA interferase family)